MGNRTLHLTWILHLGPSHSRGLQGLLASMRSLCAAGCTVVEGGQAPVAVKAEDGAEPMKVDEAPAVKAEPGSATPAAQPRSGAGAAEKAEQPPSTPANQLKSASSMALASPSPFV